jgi:WD40 repeat protein
MSEGVVRCGAAAAIVARRAFKTCSVVAWHATGETLALGTHEGRLRLVDASSGKAGRAKNPKVGMVRVLQYVGDKLVVGGQEGAALYDGGRLRSLPYRGAVQSLAAAADGSGLAIGGVDGRVTVIDLATRKVTAELAQSDKPVTFVGPNRDGSRLLAMSADGVVTLWGLDHEPKALLRLELPAISAGTLVIDPDRNLAYGVVRSQRPEEVERVGLQRLLTDDAVVVIDLQDAAVVRGAEAFEPDEGAHWRAWIWPLSLLSDGSALMGSSFGMGVAGAVAVWPLDDSATRPHSSTILSSGQPDLLDLFGRPDAHFVVTGSCGYSVVEQARLGPWTAQSHGSGAVELEAREGRAAVLGPQHRTLAEISTWRLEDGAIQTRIPAGGIRHAWLGPGGAVVVLRDARLELWEEGKTAGVVLADGARWLGDGHFVGTVFIGLDAGSLRRFDIAARAELAAVEGDALTGPLAIADGKAFIAAKKKLVIVDVATGEVLRRLKAPFAQSEAAHVEQLVVPEDGACVVTKYAGSIVGFDVASKGRLPNVAPRCTELAFGADARAIARAATSVTAFDPSTGNLAWELGSERLFDGKVGGWWDAMTFVDERRIVVFCRSDTLVFVEVATGELLGFRELEGADVEHLAADGDHLVVCKAGGRLDFFVVDPPALRAGTGKKKNARKS